MPSLNLDPSTQEFYEWENRGAWEQLATGEPLIKIEQPRDVAPFWCATNYEVIREIGTDPKTFTVENGLQLTPTKISDNPPGPPPDDPRVPVAMRPVIMTGVADHKRIRMPANPSFSPKAIRALEPRMRVVINELIDEIDPHETVDFLAVLAHPLPLILTTGLIAIDRVHADDFDRWNQAVISSIETGSQEDWAAIIEMLDFVQGHLDKLRANPGNDLLSSMLDDDLSNDELIMWSWVILNAGLETTEKLMGNGLYQLLTNPDQMAKLVADPSLTKSAVAEMLRHSAIVCYLRRDVTVDTELCGQRLREGESVIMSYRIANSDPSSYPDPEKFDITRVQNDALSFGIGPHHCIGSTFARIESRLAFEELLRRFPNVALAGEPTWQPSTFLNFMTTLPIVLEP